MLPADKRKSVVEAAARRADRRDGRRRRSTTRRRWRRPTVGIAMGTGTDVAMESAGITLVKATCGASSAPAGSSRATMRNIRQNLFLAFVYNALGVPVAAGVLYPFSGMLISPIWASAAMTLSSLSVIGNALRLRRDLPESEANLTLTFRPDVLARRAARALRRGWTGVEARRRSRR